jgi:uncharacterized protein (DUF58 family)
MIRRLASIGVTTSAMFLAVVAVMLNSPNLFYMGTALICTIAACRLQAWLSVRGLKFERVAPESVSVGEVVTVEITVWSEHRIRRPLITIWDNLPPRLAHSDRSPSFPVAPAFDVGIRTQYSFRPLRRGKYRWSGLNAVGTDALGLVTMSREYKTNVAEFVVLPAPIAVAVDLPVAAGWGISEAESGQSRGAGLEPRGVREYQYGDSLRHVHWRTSARAGQLLVKEFEAGSHASVAFLFQRAEGTEVGEGMETSLELMCGHVAYLSEQLLRLGAKVELPLIQKQDVQRGDRLREIYEGLALVQADVSHDLGEDLREAVRELTPGSTVFVMLAIADPSLPKAITSVAGSGVRVVPLVYDAYGFDLGKGKSKIQSAAGSDYADQLRGAGAAPISMPGYGSASA